MISSTINQINVLKQQRQEGRQLKHGHSLTNLIHNIIREYGIYSCGTYDVHLKDISKIDKKLLLSYVLESGDYEWMCEDASRLNLMFKENEKFIERMIDNECSEVFREDMEEMGMTSRHHSDNGETMWVRR
ncbi:MAG TPA: hypothetical protein VK622_07470 [Puia sp.]|nr:hypothetical protein [Puia sp.]